ncbi:MAG: NAD(P)-dependent oxidoreductase [Endomicrobiia bacterium]|nr:NAD(P)-dependent oxidoreductase [Endomicrobiaceae bacterium]MDD3053540.1 NAD(P)-dependent oxidoreductase [Endomicrobiaceae bacterium]MDD3922355.1 NAD(P)-dependent oxidoreductase [Endomicrobiaceae bacterium]
MRILLTGASGFVGSHILEELSVNDHEIVSIVRKTSNLKWIDNSQVILKYGSLDDEKFLQEVVQDVDVVIHCAGVVRALNWNIYNNINVLGTKKLVQSVLKNNSKLKKFIFISSQAAMGPSYSETPKLLSEKEIPVSDYGKSKLLAEAEVKALTGKVPYTILRPSSVYGPRDKDIFTFFSMVNKHIQPKTYSKHLIQLVFVKDIAKLITVILNNSNTNDKTYYLSDGQIYSWQDVSKAISLAANIKTVPVPIFDFIFKVVGNIYEIIGNITNKPQVLNKQKIIEMLQTYWIADNSQILRDVNFEFEKLENGAKITYNWYLENKYF